MMEKVTHYLRLDGCVFNKQLHMQLFICIIYIDDFVNSVIKIDLF
jgi:hypothetical protein